MTDEVIEFKNGASLEIATNDPALVRGRSAIAVLGSECCHWQTSETSESSDEEVVGAAEPSMAMTPDGGLLLLGSSVHRKRGLMYRKWKELFGNDDADDLCWYAPSDLINPKLPQGVIERAIIEDAAKAGAEFLGKWREDLSEFIPLDALDGCTDWGIIERPPEPGAIYSAFADASGGTGRDSFALAIGHRNRDQVVLDVVRERKPRFIPSQVIYEYSKLLRAYGISKICGDRFSGGFHASEWQANGIVYEACPTNTSDNYLAVLPMLLSGRPRLIDNAALRSQFNCLERVVGVGERESIRHPQLMRDDLATAAAGVLKLLSDAVSPLWERSVFLTHGQPALLPVACDLIFATLVPSKGGDCGVGYFAYGPASSFHVLDCVVERLTITTLAKIKGTLADYAHSIRPYGSMCFTTERIADQMRRNGYHGCEAVDAVIDDDLLPLAASAHIKLGRVRLCAPVLENHFSFSFLNGLTTAYEDDVLVRALLVGIVLALEQGGDQYRRAA